MHVTDRIKRANFEPCYYIRLWLVWAVVYVVTLRSVKVTGYSSLVQKSKVESFDTAQVDTICYKTTDVLSPGMKTVLCNISTFKFSSMPNKSELLKESELFILRCSS